MTGSSTAVLDAPATAPPGVGWAAGPLGEVQAADREISRQTARQVRAIAAFASSRPASADRQQGERGAMSAERWVARPEVLRPVSEWATQELAVALSRSTEAAQALLERSLTLEQRLPATLDALEDGLLHVGHLWPLLDKVAPIPDDAIRAQLERDLLAWMGGRVTTPAQLGDKIRREVLKRDARAAADRLAKAVRDRSVSARPDRTEGMSVVTALLTTPEAAALVATLGAYADALPADPDDIRSRGQKMADCLLDLVLRPGESGLPPVQVVLSVIAPLGALLGGDQPCEIDGQVMPAETVRALLTALTGHPLVTTAPTDTAPTDTAPTDTAATEGLSADEVRASDVLSEDEHFARWAEDLERRILAGEFDDQPAPCFPDEPLPDPGARDPGAPPGPHASPPSCSADTDTEGGWWARADRAVEEASTAVLAAQQVLGRAHRLVATAERAAAVDEAAWMHSAGGRVTAAPDALTALAAATDQAREVLAGLLAATSGGGLADRPRLVLTDALTGALLALTDLPALRRAATAGAGLGVPGRTDGYSPGAALDRHVRARDRRCRFPGCRRRVGHLDHAIPWPAGPTAAANLTGYCASHHRGKHQAPGWRHDLAPDGILTVTTPTGLTAVTTPPPY